jgi:hypothetical protein
VRVREGERTVRRRVGVYRGGRGCPSRRPGTLLAQ